MRPVGVAVALLLAACGGETPQPIEVTEAEPVTIPRPARPALAPLDTIYADSGLYVDPSLRLDSLRADSLRRDSLRRDSLVRGAAARPDFRTFWPAFVEAVRQGPAAVAARTAFSASLTREEFDAMVYEHAFGADPFRAGVLALTARDFERDGTAREARVVVGYGADGEIVPQDEAETESSVGLRFEVVDGAYRLVRVAFAG